MKMAMVKSMSDAQCKKKPEQKTERQTFERQTFERQS
jgi:hypothetical protein